MEGQPGVVGCEGNWRLSVSLQGAGEAARDYLFDRMVFRRYPPKSAAVCLGATVLRDFRWADLGD